MWLDRTKKHTVSFKIDDYEKEILKGMTDTGQCSQAEAIRKALWITRIIYDGDLNLKDLVTEQNWNKPLGEIILPIPILTNKIRLEFKLWNLIMQDETNANKRGTS